MDLNTISVMLVPKLYVFLFYFSRPMTDEELQAMFPDRKYNRL